MSEKYKNYDSTDNEDIEDENLDEDLYDEELYDNMDDEDLDDDFDIDDINESDEDSECINEGPEQFDISNDPKITVNEFIDKYENGEYTDYESIQEDFPNFTNENAILSATMEDDNEDVLFTNLEHVYNSVIKNIESENLGIDAETNYITIHSKDINNEPANVAIFYDIESEEIHNAIAVFEDENIEEVLLDESNNFCVDGTYDTDELDDSLDDDLDDDKEDLDDIDIDSDFDEEDAEDFDEDVEETDELDVEFDTITDDDLKELSSKRVSSDEFALVGEDDNIDEDNDIDNVFENNDDSSLDDTDNIEDDFDDDGDEIDESTDDSDNYDDDTTSPYNYEVEDVDFESDDLSEVNKTEDDKGSDKIDAALEAIEDLRTELENKFDDITNSLKDDIAIDTEDDIDDSDDDSDIDSEDDLDIDDSDDDLEDDSNDDLEDVDFSDKKNKKPVNPKRKILNSGKLR